MITASLVLYNTRYSDLNTILKCVVASQIARLYVIDNSPTDDLRKVVASLMEGKPYEYIHGQGNVGFGHANNIGIKRAMEVGSDYHIVLNPDIIFKPDVIEKLNGYMDSNEDVGYILPKVVYPNGELQYLCRLMPTPYDIFARRLLPRSLGSKQLERYEMRRMGYDKVFNCPILSGCFMFIRMDALKTVGLFDERYFMYFEDFDLIRRIHRKYKTIYYPEVSIIHNHAAEHRHNKRLFKESVKSAIRYFNKWGWLFDKERRIVNRNTEREY